MSRLNASIKLAVLLGNLLFLFCSICFVVGSILILSGKVPALAYDEAKRLTFFILGASVIMMSCTIYGCCGTVNQISRRGECVKDFRKKKGTNFISLD